MTGYTGSATLSALANKKCTRRDCILVAPGTLVRLRTPYFRAPNNGKLNTATSPRCSFNRQATGVGESKDLMIRNFFSAKKTAQQIRYAVFQNISVCLE